MGTAQDIVAAINKLRTTPTAFIPYLEARLARFEGNQIKPLKAGDPYMLTSEGPAVVEETIAFLKSAQPVGALTLSPELSAAAQDHVNDTGPKGITGHDGSDGSTSEARIERYCDWEMTIGENLDYGNTAADDIVMALCVDDGVPSRGHRNNLFNPHYKMVGVATGPHAKFRAMCALDFAGGVIPKGARPAGTVVVPAPSGGGAPAPAPAAGAVDGACPPAAGAQVTAHIVDATEMTPEIEAALAAIPFDQFKEQVAQAFADGKKVDIDLQPGKVELKIHDEGGWQGMSGNWG